MNGRSSLVLRALVRCHPPGFVRRFGGEIESVLDEEAARWRRRSKIAHLAWSTRAALDLLTSAAAQWLDLARPTRRRDGVAPWHAAVRPRLRSVSPQRTAAPPAPPFTPLPGLRRRHGRGALPARAASF